LNHVYEHQIDLISKAKGAVGPDTMVRMIPLQARPCVVETPAYNLANLIVEPVPIITSSGIKPVELAHDRQLVDLLDVSTELAEGIAQGMFQHGEWRIVKHKESSFRAERVLFDCLAIKAA
jgi:hypothetical protein